MLGRRNEIARLQSDFYRDKFRKTLKRLISLIVIIYILMLVATYAILVQPKQSYYVNTTEGKIFPMPAVFIR